MKKDMQVVLAGVKGAMVKRIADLKARQDAGEHMPCPHCGRDTMKPDVYSNALSRYWDIMICDDCGVNEASLTYMSVPHMQWFWWCFESDYPKGDFKAVTGEEALSEIEDTQLSFLMSMFERWDPDCTNDDMHYFEMAVKQKCKGISRISRNPFMVSYDVSDGRLDIKFETEYGFTHWDYRIV